jgi:3'-5' exoribonuclease 1
MRTDNTYVIMDLEATCWEKGTRPARMETIEIGAVKVDGRSMEERDGFQTFVRPVVEPVLSGFCTELTSIEQSDVDAAPTFPAALQSFLRWIGDGPTIVCSWGKYDRDQIVTDCRRHRLGRPRVMDKHLNLKRAFCDLEKVEPCGMKRALEIIGLALDGKHHRALDDARNVAKIARVILPRLDEL